MKKHLEISYAKYPDDKVIYYVEGNKHAFNLGPSSWYKGWSKPGSVFLRLEDDGNGLKVYFHGRDPIKLNYSEAEELRIALKINSPSGILKEIEYKPVGGLK